MTKRIKVGDRVRLNEEGKRVATSMTTTEQAQTYIVLDHLFRTDHFKLSGLPGRAFSEEWLELVYEYDVSEWSID